MRQQDLRRHGDGQDLYADMKAMGEMNELTVERHSLGTKEEVQLDMTISPVTRP
jgi:hypothetical protein